MLSLGFVLTLLVRFVYVSSYLRLPVPPLYATYPYIARMFVGAYRRG